MAFPAVQSSAETALSGGTLSVNMPSGLASGDLCLVALVHADTTVITPPSGFTLLRQTNYAAAGQGMSVWWKIADGSEGATEDFADDDFTTFVAISIRIDGWDSATTPASAGAVVNVGSGDPNPPDLTPAGGAKDFLWVVIGNSLNVFNASYSPASYTGIIVETGLGGVLAASYRQLNATSQNPGAFSAAGTDGGLAQTIAVYPYVAPSGSLGRSLLDGKLLQPVRIVG